MRLSMSQGHVLFRPRILILVLLLLSIPGVSVLVNIAIPTHAANRNASSIYGHLGISPNRATHHSLVCGASRWNQSSPFAAGDGLSCLAVMNASGHRHLVS